MSMWSSKMATLGQDGNINAGNSEFFTSNTARELPLSCHDVEGVKMDPQSCMDQTIVAIFEDSSVSFEDKCGAVEDSESLLSALTEMLDSVEDDDGILSPFDSLPDSKLLTSPEHRENSVELSIAERLRPRSKPPNVKFTIKIDAEKEDGTKVEENNRYQFFKRQSQALFHSNNGKTQADLEVFTSTSLVNLVKIMHPYCLKLHVEEEGIKLERRHTFFSQEEVWKFERPTDDIDEEINVVSDDEVTVKETNRREEGVQQSDNGKLLKSVLLNRTSSRGPSMEKKRVSFGPVQVASFDASMEMGLNENKLTSAHVGENVFDPLNCTKANPVDSAPEMSSEVISNHAEVLPRTGETKSKSISLQQYRQLCQQRQPLAEKRENYATKWPSVSEPPKELTPIFGLQEQRQNCCGTETAHVYSDCRRCGADQLNRSHPSEAKPFTSLCHSRLKRQRSECNIISHDNQLPGVTAIVLERKESAVKKPILQSSDPPNPVLVPLPVCQTKSPRSDHSSSVSRVEFLNSDYNLDNTWHFQEIQNKSSNTSPQQYSSSLRPKPEVSAVNWECTPFFQDNKIIYPKTTSNSSSRSPAISPTKTNQTQIKPSLKYTEVQSQNLTKETKPEPNSPLSTSQLNAPISVKETSLEIPPNKSLSEEQLPTLYFGCRVQNGTADSGIEAPDLTSLLEQFEEKQAKEENVEPTIEHLKTSCTLGSPEKDKILQNLLHLQTSEGFNIPEPLGSEIIFCTRQDLQARRKNAPSKAIQIIKPRPLPSKKKHCNVQEIRAALTPPHLYSPVSSDHDYCRPVDQLKNITQHCRATKLKDIYETSHELQMKNETGDAAECQKQTSTFEDDIRAIKSEKSAMQPFPEGPRTQSEKAPSTDGVLSVSDTDKPAPCTLPTPPPSPCARGRDRRRYRRRSPYSDSSSCSSSSSSSSSGSRSPKRQKRRHRRSESSSCSSSPSRSISHSPPCHYRWSYSRSRRSRSRSRSCSKSRSRSPVPQICSRQWRGVYSSRESRRLRREKEIRIHKLKAIEERRVVYVGCISRSMTHDELRERFSQFGEVECVSLHFRNRGDHYGFVTFHNKEDAFAAIDNGSKVRRPDELPFDLCFGGRRQFCNSDYTDLDANGDVDPSPTKSKFEGLDFDELLKQAQRGLKR